MLFRVLFVTAALSLATCKVVAGMTSSMNLQFSDTTASTKGGVKVELTTEAVPEKLSNTTVQAELSNFTQSESNATSTALPKITEKHVPNDTTENVRETTSKSSTNCSCDKVR